MTRSRTSLFSSLVVAAALLGACGGDDAATESTEPAPTEEAESGAEAEAEAGTEATSTEDAGAAGGDLVIMERSRYEPDSLEVAAGTEVTFENTDPYAHTVTSAEGSTVTFDSGELGQDETFTQTFDEAGTYEYFCEIHPTMRAEVVVA